MTLASGQWTETNLGSLGRYLNGRAFKKSEWRTSGRPIIRIQNLTGTSQQYNYFDGDAEDRHVVRHGDLLMSWAATLGAFIWNGPEAVVNQHIFKVESRIDLQFHKYLLEYKLAELMGETHGSGIVHITRGRFDALPVSLPPTEEQRRIVDILEDHLSRLDAADESLRTASLRIAAWRASAIDELIWQNAFQQRPLFELLSEPLRNGHSAKASLTGSGIRTLTLTAVTEGVFESRNTKITVADEQRVSNLWLASGDILIERSNTPALVGKAAYYSGPEHWAIFPDLVIRARVDKRLIQPEFAGLAVSSERAHRWLKSRAKGLSGSMPKIDQSTIGVLKIPVPSLDDQLSRIDQAREVLEAARRIDASVTAAQARNMALRKSLLHAAFSGQLTGQPS